MRDFAAALLPNLLCEEYRSPGLALAVLRKFWFPRLTLLLMLLDRMLRRDEFAE